MTTIYLKKSENSIEWFNQLVLRKELLLYKLNIDEKKFLKIFPKNKKITRKMLILNYKLYDDKYFSKKNFKEPIDRSKITLYFKGIFKKDLNIPTLKKTEEIWNKTIEKMYLENAKEWFNQPLSKNDLLAYKRLNTDNKEYFRLFPELDDKNKKITRKMLFFKDDLHYTTYFSEGLHRNKRIDNTKITFIFKDDLKKYLGIDKLEVFNKIWNKIIKQLKTEIEYKNFKKPEAETNSDKFLKVLPYIIIFSPILFFLITIMIFTGIVLLTLIPSF